MIQKRYLRKVVEAVALEEHPRTGVIQPHDKGKPVSWALTLECGHVVHGQLRLCKRQRPRRSSFEVYKWRYKKPPSRQKCLWCEHGIDQKYSHPREGECDETTV